MSEGYSVSSGVRVVNGSAVAYDLYVPSARTSALAGILLLHGFGADRRSLAGHAARLAGSGFAAVLTPDMSSLMSGGVEVARSRNIAQAADHALWLATLPQLAGGPGVAFAGHSAGGAVVFEAAAALASQGATPRGVCLLDGVPWDRTAAAAAAWPAAQVPLLSIRGAQDSWNLKGRMRSVLSALPAPGASCVFLPRSRHGDAIDPKRNLWALRLAGLLGAPGSSELLAALLDAFVRDALSSAPGGFEAGALAKLAAEHPDELVVEHRRAASAAADGGGGGMTRVCASAFQRRLCLSGVNVASEVASALSHAPDARRPSGTWGTTRARSFPRIRPCSTVEQG
jgi:pimeloyl-ACP methyl ester carboxylesterase